MDEFERHFAACNNARLPGERLPLRIGAGLVGWVRPEMAQELRQFAGVLVAPDAVTLLAEAADGLQDIALALSERGHFRWRREAFDVRAGASGPVLAQLDRGALPAFGVLAHGVHVNGLVRRPDGLHLWVARRSPTKQLDPGKLDHIVAGGVGAGMTPLETLVKEAGEEAAIPPELAAQAVPVGGIGYAMERPEGLRRDLLHCFDLELPEDFLPRAADGEVESFELWPIGQVLETVRQTDDFKFNVNLVLVDLFRRLRVI
jgi:8-oxo-dGTP pyrophosphatase MutT (NUDIX family)